MVRIIIFIALIVLLGNQTITVLAHSQIGATVLHMTSKGYQPSKIDIKVGDMVIFENIDKINLWPASNIHPTHQIYPEFDPQKAIKGGQIWQFKFDKAGNFKFHDHIYPHITGEIKVLGTEEKNSANFLTQNLNKIRVFYKVRVFLQKVYYQLNPGKIDQQLEVFDILKSVDKKEAEIKYFTETLGYKRVMDKLLKDSNEGSTVDCHQQAHYIGRIAYEVYGAETFKLTDYSCHSGFIHGAMEAFLSQKGTQNLAAEISHLCGQFATPFSKFECVHGVGHGVLAYHDYDLPQALSECWKLNTFFDQSSCFGGAFMENIVTAQGIGAKVGHQTLWASSDPLFPCNAIDQQDSVQTQCYLMQTSRMLDIYRYDFAQVAKQCQQAPAKWRHICFQSLGRDAAGQSLREAEKISHICSQVPQDYYQDCVLGALNVMVDFWGASMLDRPHSLCRIVEGDDNKKYCYQSLGSRLMDVFGQDLNKKREICAYSDNFQQDCLNSADRSQLN